MTDEMIELRFDGSVGERASSFSVSDLKGTAVFCCSGSIESACN